MKRSLKKNAVFLGGELYRRISPKHQLARRASSDIRTGSEQSVCCAEWNRTPVFLLVAAVPSVLFSKLHSAQK